MAKTPTGSNATVKRGERAIRSKRRSGSIHCNLGAKNGEKLYAEETERDKVEGGSKAERFRLVMGEIQTGAGRKRTKGGSREHGERGEMERGRKGAKTVEGKNTKMLCNRDERGESSGERPPRDNDTQK